MIKVVINDKNIEISENLTIEQFQKINREKKKITNDPIELLSIYTGLDINELKNAPKKEVDFVVNYLNTILQRNAAKEVQWTFTYDGVEYGLENNWDKLAWGAWQDLEIFSAQDMEENLHMIMSVLWRPIIKREKDKYVIQPYDSSTVKERAEIMKRVPAMYWFSTANFFFQIVMSYITDLNNSLNWKIKMNRLAMKAWKILPRFIQERLPQDFILH